MHQQERRRLPMEQTDMYRVSPTQQTEPSLMSMMLPAT
ncbi:hypothetical protein KN10_2868 [Anoxybacillus flavithermus NBRC 109594]|uniref:Uncharacterized protein n=1 Tax=Anoxybacillus flavithermus NBRC 109594 TaxID=1315967 RepID=R4G7C3_9BACL|nr:hypothetical protein KN10_2868 [Anoxybacillus flavithermus NBRC 109594]